MADKVKLEFFPEIIQVLPESPGGSCCLKPVIRQSNNSQKMYQLAQHIQWKFKDRLELEIPSKTDSRIILVRKYKQFIADLRKKRLSIKKLPALALAGKILCEGQPPSEKKLEKNVAEVLERNNT